MSAKGGGTSTSGAASCNVVLVDDNATCHDEENGSQDSVIQINYKDIELTLAKSELALVETASSLIKYQQREHFLGERIGRYRTLLQRREDIICALEDSMPLKRHGEEEGERRSLDNNDNDIGDFNDVELSGYLRLRERLYLMRMRYSADEVHLKCVV